MGIWIDGVEQGGGGGGLVLPSMNPSSITYFYRTTAGTRSSTPFSGSIPAGAVVELVTTA